MGVAERIDTPMSGARTPALWHGEVTVEGGRLPIALAGDGPPLILLHGWTLDGRMWLPQVAALAQHFLLVMPDRRGFGRATAPPDLVREADDVQRIADFLGFDRFALLGLSQGAAVALDCARQHGWRTAALVVSGAPVPTLVPRAEVIDIERYRAWAAAGDLAAIRADWSRHELTRHDNPATRDLVEQMLADYDGGDLLALSHVPGVPRDALAHLPMPMLAMTGAKDSVWRRDCARELAAVAPRGELALVEGAGHLANLDQPDIFNRIVADFLLKCGLEQKI
jgi:pimeloyl-ACP methyl ester carboxylesterase